MAIESGRRLGPYEIVSPLGAGGMGEVYRAIDTRLDRTVAIKVLPADFAADAQLKLRFEREAKAISQLNHPHICTLHDVGSSDGIEYLVMEHLEGETLATRISRGPLPVTEAVRYATQTADALDKAHRQGIVHRDLKPGNVMLTRSGAKLLDFGLAKAKEPISQAASASHLTSLLTEQRPLTEQGTIIGTFQYMSPEQLEGREVDARSDIFAFGVVLYEMLTGRRAFSGKSKASLIAAILATEPQPISALQPMTPMMLDRIVRICLEKDPDDRWQTAHDLKLELEGIDLSATQAATAVAHLPRRKAAAGWVAAGLIAVAGGAFMAWHFGTHEPPPALALNITPPPDGNFNTVDGPALLAPDGQRLVVRINQDGKETLWLREFSAVEPKKLSVNGYDPFWSPDGRSIGFFANGKMKRIDLGGGPTRTLCNVGDTRGATWNRDGVILFSPNPTGPVQRVSANGGAISAVTRLSAERKEIGHWRPHFLPDGKHFLYLVQSSTSDHTGMYIGSLDGSVVKQLLPIPAAAQFVEPDLVLYLHNGSLFAHRLDLKKLELVGEPFELAPSVAYAPQYASNAFSATRHVLAYHPRSTATANSKLTVLDRTGKPIRELPVDGTNLDLSRDDTRVAMQIEDPQLQSPDIWIYDLKRDVKSRLTFGSGFEIGPVWSPDGKRVAYITARDGKPVVASRLASGAGAEELFLPLEHWSEVVDWSRDGKYLLLEEFPIDAKSNLAVIDVNTKQRSTIIAGDSAEHSGRFSPDGKLIAYISNETGKEEVYLQTFPTTTGKWQVSTNGGGRPRWKGDSRELFFDVEGSINSVKVEASGAEVTLGPIVHHFKAENSDLVMTGDGSQFIVARRGERTMLPIVILTEWQRRLPRF